MASTARVGATRLLAILVFLGVSAVAITGFAITRNIARKEEKQLLHQRAGEIAVILSTAPYLTANFNMLGAAFAARGESGLAFSAAAQTMLNPGVPVIGVAERQGDEIVLRAVEGTGLSVGEALDGPHEELMRRSLGVDGLTSTLIPEGELSRLVAAQRWGESLVIFAESLIARDPTPHDPSSPYASLDSALYRTPTPDPDNLLSATTRELPLSGLVDSREVQFGSEQWLLQIAANAPLASAQARAVPWIILAGGLAAALLAAGVAAVLAQRRAYALSLADQRTAELRSAMTELETARAVADAANQAKSDFLSRMSHELRTPLNAVLGFAQLLELQDLAAEDREAVKHIIKGGNHLLTLINEVLDISRIESGDIALSPESVLIDEVVTEAVDLMRPLALARSIHLAVDPQATGHHYVFADHQRLKQVLLNLLSNAVKYNRVGGTVSVACELASSTRVRLKVTDTGPGISPEQASLLFVPFERLGANLTDVEGSGIGLALSRRLAEAMEGSLEMESTVGVGSTFWIELPLVEGAVERYQRLSGSTPPSPSLPTFAERRTILYIEDNLANVNLLERILEDRSDIELVPAMQGRIGIDLARQHRPSLILMDLHLPDLAGDEVLQTLREDPATSSIPVIVISADATPGHVQRLQAAGASAYVTKPFNVRELMQTLTEFLGVDVGPPDPGSPPDPEPPGPGS